MPCGDGGVPSRAFFVPVVPPAGLVLVVDDPLHRVLDDFVEVGDLVSKDLAEGVGFAKGIGGNGVLVTPAIIQVGGEFAFFLHAKIDEKSGGGKDSVAEFDGLGSFAMAKKGEEGQSGDGRRVFLIPRAVFVLRFLEPTQGFHGGFLALGSSSGGHQARRAIAGIATFAHGASGKATSACSGSEAITESFIGPK